MRLSSRRGGEGTANLIEEGLGFFAQGWEARISGSINYYDGKVETVWGFNEEGMLF